MCLSSVTYTNGDMEQDPQDDIVASGSISQQSSPPKKPLVVLLDESHPFDLESYISNYSGSTTSCSLVDSLTVLFT
jgi:hypothetical protein